MPTNINKRKSQPQGGFPAVLSVCTQTKVMP